jgi:hypothetical protein
MPQAVATADQRFQAFLKFNNICASSYLSMDINTNESTDAVAVCRG